MKDNKNHDYININYSKKYDKKLYIILIQWISADISMCNTKNKYIKH